MRVGWPPRSSTRTSPTPGAGQGHVNRLSLDRIDVRCADAGESNAYIGTVPADLVLLCGIFGNLADEDVARTIAAAPQLCSRDATVIWTRSRSDPDPVPSIRETFRKHDFTEVHVDAQDHLPLPPVDVAFASDGTPPPLVPREAHLHLHHLAMLGHGHPDLPLSDLLHQGSHVLRAAPSDGDPPIRRARSCARPGRAPGPRPARPEPLAGPDAAPRRSR